MLATKEEYRGKGIATRLVRMAIDAMVERDADEVGYLPSHPFAKSRKGSLQCMRQIALETEVSNTASLKLYERLGFIRSKRLHRYYLNGNTAYRLILYLKEGTALKQTINPYDQEHDLALPPSAVGIA